jgi:membrane protein
VANPLEGPIAQVKLRLERARSRYGLVDIVIRVFKRFSETDGGSYAAALTYYTFFSIFPLLAVGAAILGFVTHGDPETQKEIFDKGVEAFPMLKDALSPDGFKAIEGSRQELAVTGGLLALYAGSGAIVALEHALNKLHRIEEEPNFLEKRIRSLKWLAVLGVAALMSVGISIGATAAGDGVGGLAGDLLANVIRLAAIAVSTAVFATAFKFLPAKQQSWADVLPGAIVGGIVFELLKFAGTVFVASGQDSRNATFGAFAAAAGLLVISFLVARITLMSAEVNAVLAERRLTRQPATSDQGGAQ